MKMSLKRDKTRASNREVKNGKQKQASDSEDKRTGKTELH